MLRSSTRTRRCLSSKSSLPLEGPTLTTHGLLFSVKTLGLKFHLRWENFLSQTVKHKGPTPLPLSHVEPPDALRRNQEAGGLWLPPRWDPLPQRRGGGLERCPGAQLDSTTAHTRTHTCSYTHMHTLTCAHTLTHTHALTHSHALTYTYIHSHARTYAYTLTCMHTHIHTYTLTCTHTHMHTLTYILTCTHIFTHAHTLTCSHAHSHTNTLSHVHTHAHILMFTLTHARSRTGSLYDFTEKGQPDVQDIMSFIP